MPLTVPSEAVHSGMTNNLNFYSKGELEAARETWTKPYNKPLLLHHNSYDGEPVGRVLDAAVKRSSLKSGSWAVALALSVSDPVAEEKVRDGRYRTLSIGSKATSVICSICKVDRAKAWCDHYKGHIYDGKLCYWTLSGLTHNEVSFVNVPADPYAQILYTPENADESSDSEATVESAIETVAGVINEFANDPPAAQGKQEGSAAEEGEIVTPDGTDGAEEVPVESSSEEEPAAEPNPLQAELDQLREKVAGLESALQEAQAQCQELAGAKGAVETALAEAQAGQAQAAEQVGLLTQQNLALVRLLQQHLSERLADLEIFHGSAEERNVLIEQFQKLELRELREKISGLAARPVRRQIHQVSVPGGEGVRTESGSTQAGQKKTLEDLIDTMIKLLTPR